MTNSQPNQSTSRHGGVSAIRIDPETREWLPLTEEQISVAATAAQTVFDRTGVTPEEGARASWNLEGSDLDGSPEPDGTDWLDASDAWGEAKEAACEALAAQWPDLDTNWVSLVLDDGTRPA